MSPEIAKFAQVVVPPEQQAIAALQAAIATYPAQYNTDPNLYQATIQTGQKNIAGWSSAAADMCGSGINSSATVEGCVQFISQNVPPIAPPSFTPPLTVPGADQAVNDVIAFNSAATDASSAEAGATSALSVFDRCGL